MYLSLPKIFVYILIFFSFLLNFNAYSASQKILYSRKSISNYFSGIISSNNNNNNKRMSYIHTYIHLTYYKILFRIWSNAHCVLKNLKQMNYYKNIWGYASSASIKKI